MASHLTTPGGDVVLVLSLAEALGLQSLAGRGHIALDEETESGLSHNSKSHIEWIGSSVFDATEAHRALCSATRSAKRKKATK